MSGRDRKLHNLELRDMEPSPYISGGSNQGMRWVGYVARMKEIRNQNRVLVVNTGLIFISSVFSKCAVYEGGVHYYNYLYT